MCLLQDEQEVRQGDFGEYQIYVKTGDVTGASTKADIKLTVYGEKGRSKEFYLDRSKRHKITFQKGKVSQCNVLSERHCQSM